MSHWRPKYIEGLIYFCINIYCARYFLFFGSLAFIFFFYWRGALLLLGIHGGSLFRVGQTLLTVGLCEKLPIVLFGHLIRWLLGFALRCCLRTISSVLLGIAQALFIVWGQVSNGFIVVLLFLNGLESLHIFFEIVSSTRNWILLLL